MARLDDIHRRHNSAMNILESAAVGLRSRGQHSIARVLAESSAQARSAFAELRQYHTQVLSGIDLALQIERSK